MRQRVRGESKWKGKLHVIQDMAGLASTQEIANELGVSVNNLHKICHRNSISLPRDPKSYTGPKGKKRQAGDIECAKNLLREAGYVVVSPASF
ncbi:hypothetical protein FKG94_03285 [Exilibacterium tricleocarpae]|uniref:Uncharacterized protein n=1 Tax=Exilibacterium tricleocarpae TaxID=2591008 RepID=A0A545U6Y4_9GAMM|nr:hypothetical protein [Exilibacterium tricleocarpae]TQV85227.1 hypothetical protein FKG94_03285 [Exilibacterium tricleocarpae]